MSYHFPNYVWPSETMIRMALVVTRNALDMYIATIYPGEVHRRRELPQSGTHKARVQEQFVRGIKIGITR